MDGMARASAKPGLGGGGVNKAPSLGRRSPASGPPAVPSTPTIGVLHQTQRPLADLLPSPSWAKGARRRQALGGRGLLPLRRADMAATALAVTERLGVGSACCRRRSATRRWRRWSRDPGAPPPRPAQRRLRPRRPRVDGPDRALPSAGSPRSRRSAGGPRACSPARRSASRDARAADEVALETPPGRRRRSSSHDRAEGPGAGRAEAADGVLMPEGCGPEMVRWAAAAMASERPQASPRRVVYAWLRIDADAEAARRGARPDQSRTWVDWGVSRVRVGRAPGSRRIIPVRPTSRPGRGRRRRRRVYTAVAALAAARATTVVVIAQWAPSTSSSSGSPPRSCPALISRDDPSAAALLPRDLPHRIVHRRRRLALVAQPWVARRIRRLGQAVGLRLFVRTGHHLELTEAGKTLKQTPNG